MLTFSRWVSLLLSLLGMMVSAEESAIDELALISHRIAYSNSFGSWRDSGKRGYCRLIVVEPLGKPLHSNAYLQWIEEDSEGAAQSVSRFVPIAEINNVGVFRVSATQIAVSKTGNSIEMVAANQFTKKSHRIRITVGRVGEYDFKFIAAHHPSEVDEAVGHLPLRLDDYTRPSF